MKVLIGAPLHQHPGIFAEHRKSLDRLIIPEGVEVDYFWVLNDCDELKNQLNEGEYIVRNFGDLEYKVNEEDHAWNLSRFAKMSYLRNILLARTIALGYDYYLSADTDLILQPETLQCLLDTGKDLVSEVFWTKADEGFTWCNSWTCDQNSTAMEHKELWEKPGLYPVGMTGALFLISRAAIDSGCSYSFIPNIQTALIGEDRHFCVRAACLGIPMFMDTHYPAEHLYRISEYEAYIDRQYR